MGKIAFSDILNELNKIKVIFRDISSKQYKNKCIEVFKKDYDDSALVLKGMMEYFQIEYIPDPNKMIDQKDLVPELKKGNIAITSYGRTIIDLNTRTSILINEIEKKEKELSILKDNIFSQVLTIMGIFIVIITLIYQSITLLNNEEFMKKAFLEQLVIASAVYLPLIITIIFIIILSFIISKLFLNGVKQK